MADVRSVITFTSGRPITVPMSPDEVRAFIDKRNRDDPYMEVPDAHGGGAYLINVKEIVSIEVKT